MYSDSVPEFISELYKQIRAEKYEKYLPIIQDKYEKAEYNVSNYEEIFRKSNEALTNLAQEKTDLEKAYKNDHKEAFVMPDDYKQLSQEDLFKARDDISEKLKDVKNEFIQENDALTLAELQLKASERDAKNIEKEIKNTDKILRKTMPKDLVSEPLNKFRENSVVLNKNKSKATIHSNTVILEQVDKESYLNTQNEFTQTQVRTMNRNDAYTPSI